ncbi:MAG: hypothetical protein KIS72_03885 [Luteimonas sp.]|nr:hypothetical protein [Luteimonas sp.]
MNRLVAEPRGRSGLKSSGGLGTRRSKAVPLIQAQADRESAGVVQVGPQDGHRVTLILSKMGMAMPP